MRGTLADGLMALRNAVGAGRLTGGVEVNQIYAHYQHEHPEFHHPDGGSAFYLLFPLLDKGPTHYMRHLAANALNTTHGTLHQTMADNMEDLSMQVYLNAPWEFGDLRASGHPWVKDEGQTVYDRPPAVHRLSTPELKAKAELRYLFDPHRYA